MITFLLSVYGLSTHFIFLFKREILFDKEKFKTLLIITACIGSIHFILKIFALDFRNSGFLTMPFSALVIFYLMHKIYRGLFDDDPEDTWHSMDLKLMKDGIFNALFWVIGILLAVALAVYIF